MLIDWFTVAAQAVNFIILAWLLKRFLYGPIIKAMQERRERLSDELSRAREARQEADLRAEELLKRREELEREAQEMLTQAQAAVAERHGQWLNEARVEVEARSRAWTEAIEREQSAISERMKVRIAEQVIRLSEKVLRDLAGDDLEARSLDDFVLRLARTESSTQLSGDVVIHTGFPLSQPVLKRLEASLREHFPECREIMTSEDKSLGFGIVLVGGDKKWEWNLASYLDDVEVAVFAELAEIKAGTP